MKDEKIQQLMINFMDSEHYEKWHVKRMESYEFYHSWIQPERINEMDLDDFKEKFEIYYKNGGGKQTLNQINLKFLLEDLGKLKKTVLSLLDETIPLEERFNKIVETQEGHIRGFGKGLASAFLMEFDMEKYCIWNNKTNMGFEVLNLDLSSKSFESIGAQYINVLKMLKKLRDEISGPDLELNFDDVDSFLHWIAAENEGRESIKVILSKIEPNYWLIRAGEKGRLWEEWKERDIITIGWDIGEDMKNQTKNEIKEKIQENYPSDPGIVQGMLRKFAGTHEDKAISKGDFVVVLGDASILSIAEIIDDKPYIYNSEGLINAETHTYWKNVSYIFKGAEIKLQLLSDKFRETGDYYIHLVPTLQPFEELNNDAFNDLKTSLTLLDLFQEFVNFSKRIETNDENVRRISKLIKLTNRDLIRDYNTNFFNKFLIRDERFRNVVPFFRLITLNKIINTDDCFETLSQFDSYVEDFKEKLRDDIFPNNFKEEINNLSEIPSFQLDGVNYSFDFDFTKGFIPIIPNKLNQQFGGYKGFRFFRHFMNYYSREGRKLKKSYSLLWSELYKYLIKLLGLNPEEYFIDECSFFRARERYETSVTWAALLKNQIGDFEINENRTEGFQLYFSLRPYGINIGTFLGSSANEQLEGFLIKQVELKESDLINIFKRLQEKYKEKIKIQADFGGDFKEIRFENSLNIEENQEKIIDLFKINFELFYNGFTGSLSSFNEIVKDIFEIYHTIVQEGKVLELPDSFIKKNLEIVNLSKYNDEIIEELKDCKYIGLDLEKIVEKILKLLDAGKHIILQGAPGTGKTDILERIFTFLANKLEIIQGKVFTTACSDWTDFETIGGLVPKIKSNKLSFEPGLILRCFRDNSFTNKWLIIDELNRANIDKAFGYFFSILSNQEVELPYATLKEKKVKIIPLKKWQIDNLSNDEINAKIEEPSEKYDRYFISPNWRMGATINSSDKASLFQLSHAFIRRFGFVNIPIPDINIFMNEYRFKCQDDKKNHIRILWEAVNEYYKIGAAIIIDIDNYLTSSNTLTIFDAFEAYILPQIDTLPIDISNTLLEKLKTKFSNHEEEIDVKKFDVYKQKFII